MYVVDLGVGGLRNSPVRKHDAQLLKQIACASGLSVNGIKGLLVELCEKLGIDWPLKWKV